MRIPLWAAFGAAAGAAMGTFLDNLALTVGLVVLFGIASALIASRFE